MADGGAAVLLPQAELDARFADTVPPLLADPAARAALAAAALRLARPDAARTIADAVVALADTRTDR
jgi:UDP-N-acetylglucosamine--N-acetylmuramyl-(pentapeptide) pyrophosphoryl-undecaprenol N-acetylglucosamine transferase